MIQQIVRVHLLIIVVFFHCAIGTKIEIQTKCPKLCSCKRSKATVKCVNANMTSIPPLPAYATVLIFRGNTLNTVTSSTFKNIVNMSLERLFIPRNDIHSIEKDAFSGFKRLRFLDLSINKHIPVNEMVQALSNIKSHLTAIRLNALYLNNTNMDLVYKALSRFQIKTLYMNNNRLLALNFRTLNSTLPHLEFVDASFGSIRMIVSYHMWNLKTLLLQGNVFALDSNPFGTSPDCHFPNLTFLRLDSNDITFLDYRFKCLDKVETLMLDRNSVIKIHNDTFFNLPSLKVLTLSDLGNHVMLIAAHGFRSKSLESLDLKDNKFPFTDNPKNFRYDKDFIFKSTPKLSTLDLGGNYIQLDILRSMLLPLQSLKDLSIQFASLRNLPKDLFFKLPNLHKLDLSRNTILDWDGIRVFGNTSISLKLLDLSHNSISAINKTQFPYKPRLGLSHIDLRHNPFSCSCRNLWFTKWIDGNQSLFKDFPNDYICNEPSDWANKNLSQYRPTDTDCIQSNKLFMYIVASLSVTGIVFTIVISLVYKARWHIRYWIYLLHFKKKGYTRIMDERDDYKYDAFVVYCDNDRRWIYSKLSDKVEKEHGIKLCIHHRDFEGGKLIADNIAEHMADSRKVLIVTSRKMIKSEWCLFETRVAQEKFLNKEQGALVIILLDDLPKSEMPSSLKFLVNSTTYIQVPEQEADEERFWQDVVESLQL